MDNPARGNPHLSVLVVDEEPGIRRTLLALLEAEGHSVVASGSTEDALAEAGRRYFDLAFIDLRLLTKSGLDPITIFRAKNPWIKLVVCAPHTSTGSVIEATKSGAFDYLTKPFTHHQAAHVIHRVAEVRALEQKISALQQIYDETVPEVMLESSSITMQRVLVQARQLADSEATVLIRGESGTGKSMLARLIHSWSNRSARPFKTIACRYLSAEMCERELFGHAKGPFEAVMLDYPGLIFSCQGGALLLDEIAELSLSVQEKLLRFLKEKNTSGWVIPLHWKRMCGSSSQRTQTWNPAPKRADCGKTFSTG
ncbi:MAG: sigma 54-interacting transcriptional regulator [Syntrophobacteraceae bacterium]|nr:sigma 54-interacting transcriptional regulator [Syntrophobacteraceae bacterium]